MDHDQGPGSGRHAIEARLARHEFFADRFAQGATRTPYERLLLDVYPACQPRPCFMAPRRGWRGRPGMVDPILTALGGNRPMSVLQAPVIRNPAGADPACGAKPGIARSARERRRPGLAWKATGNRRSQVELDGVRRRPQCPGAYAVGPRKDRRQAGAGDRVAARSMPRFARLPADQRPRPCSPPSPRKRSTGPGVTVYAGR